MIYAESEGEEKEWLVNTPGDPPATPGMETALAKREVVRIWFRQFFLSS